jgi:PleD family two-component response regulator
LRGHETVAQPTAFEASTDATAPQEQAPTETALEGAVAPEPSKVAVPQPAEPGVRRMQVMAAEDNRTNRFAVEKMLKALNSGLVFAESGFEAIEAFQAARPDIFFTDISMPKMMAGGPASHPRDGTRAGPGTLPHCCDHRTRDGRGCQGHSGRWH